MALVALGAPAARCAMARRCAAGLATLLYTLVLALGGAALLYTLVVARRSHEAVDLRRLRTAEVEARSLAVIAQHARAGIGPLRLVRVDVDAGARLLVVPAARQLLAAHEVALHGLAVGLAHGHVCGAVGAGALREEGGVLAGAGHAELHLAALGPLLLLAVNQVLDDLLLALALVLGLRLEARLALRRRLRRQLGLLLLPHDVAPRGAGGARRAHAQHHLQVGALQQRVLVAVARALGVVVGLVHGEVALLALEEPAPVAALPHGVAVVLVQAALDVALAAGPVVELLAALGVPALECRVAAIVVVHGVLKGSWSVEGLLKGSGIQVLRLVCCLNGGN